MNRMFTGNWMIETLEDGDGHLAVFITNSDESEIIQTNTEMGKENEWAERFTTTLIEKKYQETL